MGGGDSYANSRLANRGSLARYLPAVANARCRYVDKEPEQRAGKHNGASSVEGSRPAELRSNYRCEDGSEKAANVAACIQQATRSSDVFTTYIARRNPVRAVRRCRKRQCYEKHNNHWNQTRQVNSDYEQRSGNCKARNG